jgi:hypothetical protein
MSLLLLLNIWTQMRKSELFSDFHILSINPRYFQFLRRISDRGCKNTGELTHLRSRDVLLNKYFIKSLNTSTSSNI